MKVDWEIYIGIRQASNDQNARGLFESYVKLVHAQGARDAVRAMEGKIENIKVGA